MDIHLYVFIKIYVYYNRLSFCRTPLVGYCLTIMVFSSKIFFSMHTCMSEREKACWMTRQLTLNDSMTV